MYIIIGINPDYSTRYYKSFTDMHLSQDMLNRCLANRYPNCEELDYEEEIRKVNDGTYYYVGDNYIKVITKQSGWFSCDIKMIHLFTIIKITEFNNHSDELKHLLEDFKNSETNIKPSQVLLIK